MRNKISTYLAILLSIFILVISEAWGKGETWLPTGNMAVARRDHTATLLTNNKVLIIGWDIFKTAEIYDPTTGTFSSAGKTLFLHGQGQTVTRLLDGRVLIVGGNGDQTSAEIYDPSTGEFSRAADLNYPHSFHTATLLPDGTVLIAGGQDSTAGPQTHAIVELYDPETDAFRFVGKLNDDRSGHTATLLPGGYVLIAGGTQTTKPGYGIRLSSAELYEPINKTFKLLSDMNEARSGHSATLLLDGRVLLAGTALGNSAELYDPKTETFTPTRYKMKYNRAAHTATLLNDGKVLLAGGSTDIGPATTNSAELFDPVSEDFFITDSMTTNRQQHTATLLRDGTVLVVGGYDGMTDMNTTSAELYGYDYFPPIITVPAKITTDANEAYVTYSVTATDNVDGIITPDCSPVSGSAFPVGTSVVTCTATDSSGNTAIEYFLVEVINVVPHFVVWPDDITAEATGPGGASVFYIVSALDAPDGPIVPV